MGKRRAFENLDVPPAWVARVIATQEYTGMEWSNHVRSQRDVDKIEERRLLMTPEQIDEFCKWCETRCRLAYELKCEWFMKIVHSRTNSGRDRLHVLSSHWLGAYLTDPTIASRDLEAALGVN